MTAFEIDHDRETQSACSSQPRIYAYNAGCKPGEKFCDRTLSSTRSMSNPSVIGLAAQTNHLVTAMQIPVDPEFDNAKYCAISR